MFGKSWGQYLDMCGAELGLIPEHVWEELGPVLAHVWGRAEYNTWTCLGKS
jgi:hypothetical protein